LNTDDDFIKNLNLKKLLLIGSVKHTQEDTYISTFDSHKCHRCWNYFYPKEIKNDICITCQNVIEKYR
jgi:isoleucyl-tRNA synthetase